MKSEEKNKLAMYATPSKAEEESKSVGESGDVVDKSKKSEYKGPKITFEDYEKLMERLEKEENWEEIAS